MLAFYMPKKYSIKDIKQRFITRRNRLIHNSKVF